MILPPGTILAAGPVIIEQKKVLLVRQARRDGSITPWYFPGGRIKPADTDITAACQREAKEELGIAINVIAPLNTTTDEHNGMPVTLYHFLAKRIGDIHPGPDIVEWGWHNIYHLPKNCAPNVYKIIKSYKNSQI